MARRRAQTRDIDAAAFVLTDEIRLELAEKFPRVDLDKTYELFRDNALAKGWLYADWRAAFRNYIRNGAKYGGVEYRGALHDPAFERLIEKAKAIGFRMPGAKESSGAYRTALEHYDRVSADRAKDLFGNVLKRIEK